MSGLACCEQFLEALERRAFRWWPERHAWARMDVPMRRVVRTAPSSQIKHDHTPYTFIVCPFCGHDLDEPSSWA